MFPLLSQLALSLPSPVMMFPTNGLLFPQTKITVQAHDEIARQASNHLAAHFTGAQAQKQSK